MPESTDQQTARPWKKLVVVAVIAVIGVGAYLMFGDRLNLKYLLEYLASHEDRLRQFQSDHSVLVLGAAFVFYVAVTGLSIPGAALLSLSYGWYFGWIKGVILVSFASTAGATAAFLLSRYLLRESVQSKFGDRLKTFNENLESEGPFYLFTLRLIPAVPFFLINVVMGLTPMKARTFWWVSQIGMLPATIVYLYAGSTFPNLQKLSEEGLSGLPLKFYVAFALLGLFPLVIRKLVGTKQTDPAIES